MRPLVALATVLASGALVAAPTAPASDPADVRAPQARREHCSVLRSTSAPPAPPAPLARDWRQANAATVEAGGWRAYAREAASAAVPTDPCDRRRP